MTLFPRTRVTTGNFFCLLTALLSLLVWSRVISLSRLQESHKALAIAWIRKTQLLALVQVLHLNMPEVGTNCGVPILQR